MIANPLILIGIAVVMTAVMIYLPLISEFLPFGESLTLAAGWLGLNGEEVSSAPIWGALVRFAHGHLPGTAAAQLGAVSLIAGAICVWLFTYAIGKYLDRICHISEAQTDYKERKYEVPMIVSTLLASFAFVLTPGFLFASTRANPLMVAMVFPLAAFALVGHMLGVKSSFKLTYHIILIGLLMAMGVVEGRPGLLTLPIILVLLVLPPVRHRYRLIPLFGLVALGMALGLLFSLGDDLSAEHLAAIFLPIYRSLPRSLLFPGLAPLLAAGLLPVFIFHKLSHSGRMKSSRSRSLLFGGWTLAIVGLIALNVYLGPTEHGRAVDTYVTRALAALDGREFVITDGVLDDMVLLKKAPKVKLITFSREYDPEYGLKLAKEMRGLEGKKVRGEGEDKGAGELEFAAELGPSKLMETWLNSDPKSLAENCYFLTVRDPAFLSKDSTFVPKVYGWSLGGDFDAEAGLKAWEAAWEEFKPLIERRKEPGADWVKHLFAVEGNAVGALANAAKRQDIAWQAHYRVFDAVDAKNFSALVNLTGLADQGYKPDETELIRVREELKTQTALITSQDRLRRTMAHYGRIFVDPATRDKVMKLRDELRKTAWESDENRTIRSAFEELDKIYRLRGDEMAKAIGELEQGIAKQMALKEEGVAKWLFTAEMLALKGGEKNLWAARDNYRKVLKSGEIEQSDLVADRLLSMDIALNDHTELEFDSLLVLRHNLRHRYANALLGSIRAMNGKFESAERYLRRAMEVGEAEPGMKNDLAMVLSGQGKYEEAEKLIRELVKEYPENWNFLDSCSQILSAAGKKTEADEMMEKARAAAEKAGDTERFEDMLNRRR